jgi:predicted metal-dependent enzyme (double-stranded beta helix superfamily)
MQGFLSADTQAGVLRGLRTGQGTRSRDFLAAARGILSELVASPDLVARLKLERKPGGYSRNLLAGDDEVSVWAIVWSPGAATPIHDHHCACAFAVVSGTITETWYRDIGDGKAVPTNVEDRQPGYVAAMLPSGPNIHRIHNAHDGEAISIHIYGFDHEAHPSSIESVFSASEG